MSIYVAARLQRAQRKRARMRNFVAATLSFVVTSISALAVLPGTEQAQIFIAPEFIATNKAVTLAKPTSLEAMLSQDVFKLANKEPSFEDTEYPSAMEIVQGFSRQRFVIQEARARAMKPDYVDPIAVAAISAKRAESVKATEPETSFTQQPMPKLAALEAIEAIGQDEGPSITRDPSLPFPVSVPTKLAYARDNAPKTKDLNRPLTQASMIASQKQHWCMATAIYFEARGESYRGQVAVAQVVRNRVKHKAYPNSICSVVFQNQSWRNRCQFSFACDGIPERVNEKAAWKQAEEIATKVIDGDIYLPEVANATHYHATYVWPKWAPRLKKLAKIGTHIFYRFKKG